MLDPLSICATYASYTRPLKQTTRTETRTKPYRYVVFLDSSGSDGPRTHETCAWHTAMRYQQLTAVLPKDYLGARFQGRRVDN